MWSRTEIKSLTGLAALLLYAAPAAAGSTPAVPRAVVRVSKVTRPPKLSDFLDGQPREAETVISEFLQREPNDGQPATRQTKVYLSYDDKNFYAIFVCQEDPARLRAHLGRREEFSGDDWVSLTLDTFHDGHSAYMFFSNPLGVQKDGITTEGQADDFTFDTLWYTEGRITNDGFIVWMAIPFKSLRFSTTPGSTWGIALSRSIRSNKEISTWPYITNRIEAYVPQFGTLEGIERIRPGRNVQLIPYGFFAKQRFLNAPDNAPAGIERKTEWRGGLDAKVVLHDRLTIDATLNPDFSQVESDEPQVTVNQRFEVFFPERRPFFTEGAGYFQTPETLFFSRRIADPQFGVRMTGKAGQWGIGALLIDDRAPGHFVDATDPLRDTHARIAVGRIQYEFPGQSTAGLFYSRRDFGSSTNQVVSLDTRLKLNANWVLTAQAIHSNSRALDGFRTSGNSLFAEIRRSGRRFNYYTFYRDRSPGFDAQMGFIQRRNIRQVKSFGGWRWWRENGLLVNYGPAVYSLADWDHQGRLQDWYVDMPFSLNFKGPMSFTFGRKESYEFFETQGFRKWENDADFLFERYKWMSLTASYTGSTAVNFFPANGLAPFLGKSTEAELGLIFRPASRLRLDEKYIYERLGTFNGSHLAGVPQGTAIFTNHLVRTKVNYQFTRSLSLRAIVDYNAVLENASLVDLEREKHLTYDVLFTYLPHPGTAVYLGYTDRLENVFLDPTRSLGIGRNGSPNFSTGRQLFIKVSYQFRF